MTKEEKSELYKELAEHYGEKHQCMLCIEEMSELIKEIVKFERKHNNYNEIAEEVADVQIMIEQVIAIYGINEEVERWKEKKLKRTEARLAWDITKENKIK